MSLKKDVRLADVDKLIIVKAKSDIKERLKIKERNRKLPEQSKSDRESLLTTFDDLSENFKKFRNKFKETEISKVSFNNILWEVVDQKYHSSFLYCRAKLEAYCTGKKRSKENEPRFLISSLLANYKGLDVTGETLYKELLKIKKGDVILNKKLAAKPISFEKTLDYWNS